MQAVVLGIALALGMLAPELVAEAQPAQKVYRIGWLDPSPADFPYWRETFLAELKTCGGAAGEYALEWRQPGGLFEQELDDFPKFAAELVGLGVDVIVALGPPALAARVGGADRLRASEEMVSK